MKRLLLIALAAAAVLVVLEASVRRVERDVELEGHFV